LIWVLTGPEGAGKSSVMTALAITQHNFYIREKGIDLPIYTFPGYEIIDDQGKAFSQEIKTQDWITLPEEMKDLILCIDEAQIFFDSRTFMTMTNRLFNSFAIQRRHRNLTLYMCLQDFGMLDKRLRYSAHLVSYLWDDYWTQRSFGNKTQRGRKVLIRTIDNKGFITGFPRTRIFPDRECLAYHAWNNYSTKQITSVFAGMDKVNIQKQEIKIKNGKVVYQDDGAEDLARERISETVGLILDDLDKQGINRMNRDALRELIYAQGIQCSIEELGTILKEQGVTKSGGATNRSYNLNRGVGTVAGVLSPI